MRAKKNLVLARPICMTSAATCKTAKGTFLELKKICWDTETNKVGGQQMHTHHGEILFYLVTV